MGNSNSEVKQASVPSCTVLCYGKLGKLSAFYLDNMKDKLKLSKVRKYSLEESGLTKLIFDEDSVDLCQNDFPFRISLRINLDEYVCNSQVSETEYERLICPVYMLEGRFVDFSGSIYGVIRPARLRNSVHPVLMPNIPPEFHYYIDSSEGYEVGRSLFLENERLICGLIDCKMIDRDDINSKFNVNLPSNHRRIYFKRTKD